MASSVAGCLRSVGYDMPRVFDVMALLDIDCVVEALTVQLQDMGSAALYCPHAAPTQGVVSCTYEQWFRPYSLVGVIVICLFLVGSRNVFCSLGLVAIACLLLLVVLLALLTFLGLTGCAWLAIGVLWGMRCTWFLSILPLLLCGLDTQACSQAALTP
ncbi:TPA: hypothetical protein ACH3X1_001601 [Trebouxia sp. C0004]